MLSNFVPRNPLTSEVTVWAERVADQGTARKQGRPASGAGAVAQHTPCATVMSRSPRKNPGPTQTPRPRLKDPNSRFDSRSRLTESGIAAALSPGSRIFRTGRQNETRQP
ncbi:hypothetical protein DPEC_G00277820 [Dallia pectoralis]|uniref:Uncharacterized protein n=1 Tax=Dallia pectoralis TaxID=75939 RepID=A0ACC2FM87_DALPE|nr:hypothetical protein DPEC_G00277820 [Dallia pectoralis]